MPLIVIVVRFSVVWHHLMLFMLTYEHGPPMVDTAMLGDLMACHLEVSQ